MKPRVLTIRTTDEIMAKLKQLAAAENRTVTNYLENLIDQQPLSSEA